MTMQELNQKYEDICKQIGDISYKIRQHKQLLSDLYVQVDKLNEIAAVIQSTSDNKTTIDSNNKEHKTD